MPSKRWLFPLLPVVAVAITAIIFPGVTRKIIYGPGIGAGIAAELGCAGVFVMHRAPEDVMAQDVVPTDPLLAHATLAVEKQQQSATVTLLGRVSRAPQSTGPAWAALC